MSEQTENVQDSDQESMQTQVEQATVEEVAGEVPLPEPSIEMDVDPVKLSDDAEAIAENEIKHESLSFLNVDMNELKELSDNYPNIDGASDEAGRAWLAAFMEGTSSLIEGSSLSAAANKANAKWRQMVEQEGDKLGITRPRFGQTEGGVISGEKAILKVTSSLGLGANVMVPLWHSGIWVSIKAPSESSLLELERRIGSEKITLGRYTSGLLFSNSRIYMTSHVVNFILNHVYDASVKNISQEALKKMIKITDIPTLVWGMACAIYPNGYKYSRPCTTNPSACQYVAKGTVQLTKMFWVDNDALTSYQKRMMSRRSDKFSDQELKRYEDEHSIGGIRKVQLSDKVSVKFRVPTIAQYEQAGFNWVDGIVSMVEGSLGVSLTSQERNEYIMEQGRVTALRQYSHWVSEIEVDNDIVKDRETLDEVLSKMTSNEMLSTKLYEEMGKFIDESSLSMVAIPKYKCPKCGGEQEGDMESKHPHLLPIDAVKVFFTLLDQRVFKVLMTRQL